MNEERIFIAASSGTKSQSAPAAVISRASSSSGVTVKPMSVIAPRRICTSLMRGTLRRMQASSVSAAAAIILRTAFLAPAIRTSP